MFRNSKFKNKDLFKFPTMINELDEIAADVNGKTKNLTSKQLDSIRREGYKKSEKELFSYLNKNI